MFDIKAVRKFNIKSPTLILGLPGIGNVGKIALDFLVDKLGAKLVCTFESNYFPPLVFINEKNLVDMPTISLFYSEKKNILFVAGDVQPVEEASLFVFCNKVLDIAESYDTKAVISLGGIGLQGIPKQPKVFCTGTERKFIEAFVKDTKVSPKPYGIVGPIIGATGLLVGLAGRRKMSGVALLAETYAHPMYVGVKGAREILRVLNFKLRLGINLGELDDEIAEIEKEMRKLRGVDMLGKIKKDDDISYIG